MTDTPKRLAASYSRVSTDDQAKGISPQMQPDKIQLFADLYDYSIPPEALFCDNGFSGRSTKHRKDLERAIQWCIENKATLIVYDLDRFMRNTREALNLEWRLGQAGASLASVNQRFDTSSPEGYLMFTFFLGIAQYESDKNSRRTKDCLRRAREDKRITNSEPIFGWTRDMDRPETHRVRKTIYYPHLKEVPEEQETIALADEYRKKHGHRGCAPNSASAFQDRRSCIPNLAEYLNGLGRRNRGGKLWTDTSASKMLKRWRQRQRQELAEETKRASV